jgi:hypothetical protein
MGAAVGSAGEIADSLREAEARPWRRMLAPVRVIAAPKPPEVTFILPAGLRCATIDWMLAEEPPRSVARPASVSNRECPPPRSDSAGTWGKHLLSGSAPIAGGRTPS